MIDISYLSDILPGQTAYIYNIAKADIRRRLCELGFVDGTKIKCVARAPMSGPSAYLIRGALIALRRADARCVSVGTAPPEKWD